MKYQDITQDTPRLVVTFQHDVHGNEQFSWGVVGKAPMMTLIGFIVRVQAELAFRAPLPCPEKALVIVWDALDKKFSWFCHPDIPVDSLVGMLEITKTLLVGGQISQQQPPQQPQKMSLFGPDGQPIIRR